LPRYYLDTTAHVERWAGEKPVQEGTRELLGNDTHATSTHAEREWKRLMDQSAGDILNAAREGPLELSDVLARLSQGRGREGNSRLRVLSLLNRGESSLGPDLPIRARTFLRYKSRLMFRQQIDTVRDATECGLARNETTQQANGRYVLVHRCKKTDKICRQDQFLGEKVAELRAAGTALMTSGRDADRKMGDRALTAAANPNERKGVICYGHLGDVVIALECAADETILTSDASFGLIGPALARSVEKIPVTPSP
jgi:hypothetical protein